MAPKIDKKGDRGPSRDGTKAGPGKVAEKRCFGGAPGHQKGAKNGPKGSQKRTKKGVDNGTEKRGLSAPCRTTFGSFLGAFLEPKTVRERPRTDFSAKSVIVSKQ